MQKYLPALQKCALFAGVEERDVAAMLACLGARVLRVKKDASVFCESAPAREVGVVLSGAVRIERADYYGNRSILAHIGPGELFAETYACAGVEALPVDIVADEGGEMMLIDCRRITTSCTSACAFHSRVVHNLLRIVAQKNLLFDRKIEITSRRTTREKLTAYLLQEAKLRGTRRFTVPYDRQELADYLEVDRSGLSAEIGKLRREGVLRCEKSMFELL